MKCPNCGRTKHRCLDSRPTDTGRTRRRKVCLSCQKRFTTLEVHIKDGDGEVSMELANKRLLRTLNRLDAFTAAVRRRLIDDPDSVDEEPT